MLDEYKRSVKNNPTDYIGHEFWLFMAVIDVLHNKFCEYRGKMNDAKFNSDEQSADRYYFQEGAVVNLENEMWQLYDMWEKINKESKVVKMVSDEQ